MSLIVFSYKKKKVSPLNSASKVTSESAELHLDGYTPVTTTEKRGQNRPMPTLLAWRSRCGLSPRVIRTHIGGFEKQAGGEGQTSSCPCAARGTLAVSESLTSFAPFRPFTEQMDRQRRAARGTSQM